SRRRHTRFSRDWSSDVCSSDLLDRVTKSRRARFAVRADVLLRDELGVELDAGLVDAFFVEAPNGALVRFETLCLHGGFLLLCPEIGRASCRERVWLYVLTVK